MATWTPRARTYSYQILLAAQCALLFQLTKSGFESLTKCSSHQGHPPFLAEPSFTLSPCWGIAHARGRGGVHFSMTSMMSRSPIRSTQGSRGSS